jgi:hypothetical protein
MTIEAEECNIRMFKKGIKPVWECPENMHGGKWVRAIAYCFSTHSKNLNLQWVDPK